MKKLLWIFLVGVQISAQSVAERLDAEMRKLLSSNAILAASLSFYVCDDNGNLVYDYNGSKGLSTASTQKIMTAAAALDLLGADYRYETRAAYSGTLRNGVVEDLYITSNGDPTLGSWRYNGYKPEDFKRKLLAALAAKNITEVTGNLVMDDSFFDFQTTPGGWPWNDIGNYYGAGIFGINWSENQFEVSVRPGSDNMTFKNNPQLQWVNETKGAGSGDNSIIYTAPYSDVALINGSLPAGKSTTVSGAVPNPPLLLGQEIAEWLQENGIKLHGSVVSVQTNKTLGRSTALYPSKNTFFTYQSPKLTEIVFWFLRKSVNLYGEAFVKTIGKESGGKADFETGIKTLKSFWVGKGIAAPMINFADGSGLSPQNYVSAKAEAQALAYARKQKWFPAFYDALPTYNQMKMKSGTIKDSKAYAGYHTSKDGTTYVFSMIINNYSGGSINPAMFRVLDVLK